MSAIIVGYARTPFVRFNGQFATVRSTDLGAHAIRSALERAGVAADRVDRVVAGQVLQAAVGQNPARQSAVAAGLPLTTPAITVNAVCLSGSEAVAEAARLIDAGEAHVVVAVGQESMSLAPHAWSGSRAGQRYGAIELVDTLENDGLTDAFAHRSMGAETEDGNGELGIARDVQDAVAAASHARAAASAEFLAGEIAPFEVPSRRGATLVSADDGIRPESTVESLAKLRPAFAEDGTITAGNASQITDGAAALVLVSREVEAELGLVGIATVESHALVAGPDTRLHEQPANAIVAALARIGADAAELRAVEINEAFAAVAVRSTATLGIDPAIVNPHGGAIALGHPIGASGTRVVGTLARELRALGTGSLGAAALCGGGGQGSAIVLRAR
ncbi:acetyl-CoA C-acyltransferase [Pseudoclavibacter chungangensis]|uniref:Probable acetyl-CoA acetyltransferase n=1 Tax=Pseudoclavibacter chungangensis TaxID=587635 RepID=A0A7J5C2J8_9MICO|nr:acetyl-CoA C-acyltransferase [Pseudoclavibacter chungangensis]KAB1662412.1 acetyl-CoA C-acyltransferase [Pseudoclavibacter chungangensis]NYJ68438.1 acetyl-CoA C-acetyltransferase [Pseudoclavibacter chungangensis]